MIANNVFVGGLTGEELKESTRIICVLVSRGRFEKSGFEKAEAIGMVTNRVTGIETEQIKQ